MSWFAKKKDAAATGGAQQPNSPSDKEKEPSVDAADFSGSPVATSSSAETATTATEPAKADAESKPTAEKDKEKDKDKEKVALQPLVAPSARLDIEVQLYGNLYKKDTAGTNTWQERLFVLKDGFLMYFAASKVPAVPPYDQLIHPKGVFPLDSVGECGLAETCRAMRTRCGQAHRTIAVMRCTAAPPVQQARL
jgi:hypothetical protein